MMVYVLSVSDPLFCRVRCADLPTLDPRIQDGPHSGPYKTRQSRISTPLNMYMMLGCADSTADQLTLKSGCAARVFKKCSPKTPFSRNALAIFLDGI